MEGACARSPLSPSALSVLERARRLALSLHATELCMEHVFCALLEDEDNAACQALLAAFADPQSLAREALATANGILVVASHSALPFSTLGVRALFGARELAALRGEPTVTPARIALAAWAQAPAPFRQFLLDAGFSELALESQLPAAGAAIESNPDESIFRRFGTETKKLLATSARAANGAGEASISPQRLLIAALGATPELQAALGASVSAALRLPSEMLADPTPAPERDLPQEASLQEFLARLPAGADTLDLLLGCFEPGQSLLAQLLARQRLQADQLAAHRGVGSDPDPG